MQNSERVLISLIIIVGSLLMYILFIFFDPGGRLNSNSADPPPVITNLDDLEDDESHKDSFQFSRSSGFTLRDLGNPTPVFQDNQRPSSLNLSGEESIEQKLLDSKAAYQIPLSTRQDHLRSTLLSKGFTNEKFIQLMLQGSDDDAYLDAGVESDHFLEQGNVEKAIQIYEDLWLKTEENNHQIKSEIARKIIQLSMMIGNMSKIKEYSKKYFLELESIVSIYKETKIMKSSFGRETIYNMEQAIKTGKSGSIINFLQLIKAGQVNPRELITGLKVAATNSDPNGYQMSNADILEAEKNTENIFKNYTK